MKTIKVASNYGNFATELKAEVGENLTEATELLCEQGLLNILYRVSGSYVDKALGVDKKKLGTTRKDDAYSDAEAEVINKAVSDKLTELEAELGIETLKLSFRVTGQYFYGEGGTSPMARASLFVDSLLGNEATEPQLRATLKVLGMEDAETASRDELVKFAHSKGLGIQPAKKKSE